MFDATKNILIHSAECETNQIQFNVPLMYRLHSCQLAIPRKMDQMNREEVCRFDNINSFRYEYYGYRKLD